MRQGLTKEEIDEKKKKYDKILACNELFKDDTNPRNKEQSGGSKIKIQIIL